MFKKLFLILCLSILPFKMMATSSDLIDVGLSTVNLSLPEGVPLGGFGDPKRRIKGVMDLKDKYPYCFFFKPNEGVLDPVYVRSMALRKDGILTVFVSMDVVGITKDFVYALVKRLKKYGITRENLNFSATHTHAGPGALTKRFFLGLLAVDVFNQKVFDHVIAKVEKSVVKAILNLEPAFLYDLTFKTEGLQRNRQKIEGHFDPHARMLLAKNIQGEWLGGIFNYAIHGTFYLGSNLKLSADAPGAMTKALEDQFQSLNMLSDFKPTILFINGAEGDVAPRRIGGRENISAMGSALTNQMMANLEKIRPVLNPEISYKREKVFVGIPRINLKSCLGKTKFYKFLPGLFSIPLIKAYPMKSILSTVSIGDVTMMTWPGEPTTSIGYQLQDLAKEKGHHNPWIFSLSNDHLSYFVTKEEYKSGYEESCHSFYGYRGGKRILKKFSKMLEK